MPLVGVFDAIPDRFKLRGLGGLGVERRTDPVALIMLVPGRHQHQPSLRNATTATVCQRETHRVTGVALELLHRWITDPAPRFPADVTPRPSGLVVPRRGSHLPRPGSPSSCHGRHDVDRWGRRRRGLGIFKLLLRVP